MKFTTFASTIAFAFAVSAVPAAAAPGGEPSDCSLRIDSSSTNWVIQGFDPFAASEPLAMYDVTFSNDGGAACTFDPVFVTDQEPFGLTNAAHQGRVTYTLLDTFSGTNATPVSGRTVGNANRRPVVVQPHTQQVVRFQFSADESGLTADGLYSQRLSLVAEKRGTGAMLGARAFVVGVDVLPSAVLGLSGQYRRNGGQAIVDLGELQDGVANVALQVRVASTRAYRLEFSSKNSGVLRLSDTQWTVPYQIALGEKTMSLSSRGIYESTGTNPTTDLLPLHFLINGASGKRAGLYSDLITVAIAPK